MKKYLLWKSIEEAANGGSLLADYSTAKYQRSGSFSLCPTPQSGIEADRASPSPPPTFVDTTPHRQTPNCYLRLPTITSLEASATGYESCETTATQYLTSRTAKYPSSHRSPLDHRHRTSPPAPPMCSGGFVTAGGGGPPSGLYPPPLLHSGGQLLLAGAPPGTAVNDHVLLRSHDVPTHHKAIPNSSRVDLEQYQWREATEWSMDDVISWIISIARRHHIPMENINIERFANCTGAALVLMSRQQFVDREPHYGHLLYMEFLKLVGDECSFVDDWMRRNSAGIAATPSTSQPQASSVSSAFQPPSSSLGVGAYPLFLPAGPSSAVVGSSHRSVNGPADLTEVTGRRQPINVISGQPDDQLRLLANRSFYASPTADRLGQTATMAIKEETKADGTAASIRDAGGGAAAKFAKDQRPADARVLQVCKAAMKKNKDGKPRKRSTHNKGNKLWEFIRDALKDPLMCPTVVRWEDPIEGVFRIVESEKLARMWGDKKNNKKMTYEKLSRAMRTYYEKLILVPVPKTGIYPKKLVYKFGPNAGGWRTDDKSVDQCSSPPSPPPALVNQTHSHRDVNDEEEEFMDDHHQDSPLLDV